MSGYNELSLDGEGYLVKEWIGDLVNKEGWNVATQIVESMPKIETGFLRKEVEVELVDKYNGVAMTVDRQLRFNYHSLRQVS